MHKIYAHTHGCRRWPTPATTRNVQKTRQRTVAASGLNALTSGIVSRRMSGARLPTFAVTACVFRIFNHTFTLPNYNIRLLQWNSAINCAALVMRKVAEMVTQRGQSKPPKGLARFIELANMKLDRPLDDASLVFDSAVRDPSKNSQAT